MKNSKEIELIQSVKPDAPEVYEGFNAVELDLYGLKPLTDNQLVKIKNDFYSMGVRVYSIHAPDFKLSHEANFRGKALGFIKKMHRVFDNDVFVFHPGRGELFFESFDWLSERVPNRVKIVIEIMSNPKSRLSTIDSINVAKEHWEGNFNIGFCLDTSHIFCENLDSYNSILLKVMMVMGDKLYHVHASDIDSDGITRYMKHLPFGEGIIDWFKVKQKLEELEYDGGVVLEIIEKYRDDYINSMKLWANPERKEFYMHRNNYTVMEEIREQFERFAVDWDKDLERLLRIPKNIRHDFVSDKKHQYVLLVDGIEEPKNLLGSVFPNPMKEIKWGISFEVNGSTDYSILFWDRIRRIFVKFDIDVNKTPSKLLDEFKQLISKAIYQARVDKNKRGVDFIVAEYSAGREIILYPNSFSQIFEV